jgi:hypothetical protein
MKIPNDKKSPCGHTGDGVTWQKPLDTISIPNFQRKLTNWGESAFGYSTTVKPNVKIIFTLSYLWGVNHAY